MSLNERHLLALQRLLDEQNRRYQTVRDMFYAEPQKFKEDSMATDLREYIDALNYTIRQMQDDRIHISGHTVMVGMSVFLFVMSMAAIIAAFLN